MISIMKESKHKYWPIIFWILIWQISAMIINQKILIASPYDTLAALIAMAGNASFYLSILASLFRILIGLLLGMAAASISSWLAFRYDWFRQLIAPFVLIIKTIPVASFIILILIWVDIDHLPVLIAWLMTFPIMYENIYAGIVNTDQKLVNMAHVFALEEKKIWRYIYMNAVYPYFRSGFKIAIGLSFKAGIAAEIIGLVPYSIGDNLYDAKIYLATADLFAWTIVIVVLSLALNKLADRILFLWLKRRESEL